MPGFTATKEARIFPKEAEPTLRMDIRFSKRRKEERLIYLVGEGRLELPRGITQRILSLGYTAAP